MWLVDSIVTVICRQRRVALGTKLKQSLSLSLTDTHTHTQKLIRIWADMIDDYVFLVLHNFLFPFFISCWRHSNIFSILEVQEMI